MLTVEISIKEALKQYFGFTRFKGDQERIIRNVLEGNDSFVIMPTGGGKSMCYQLPALLSEGTAIVVSPLIALMKNQVDSIRGFGTDDGVAHFLNSSLSKAEIERVKSDVSVGKTKLLYVAPESLTKQDNVDFLTNACDPNGSIRISFIAIDEAHCISEWGHDFRPEYRRLRPIVERLGNTPIIALTATATPKVQQDILKNLRMSDATIFKSSFNRPNLYYEVLPKIDVVKQIIRYIKDNKGKSGIVYCLSRKKVEEIAETLQVNDIKALPYHAGMDAVTRTKNQDLFLMEDADVMVATIAFGMGIDKPDIRYVIHHDIPKSLESYYQETGRAGRDGGEGRCLAFYSYKDIEKLEKFFKDKPVAEQEIGKQLLLETITYAESSICRRKQLLHYFGEKYTHDNCNNCDNCLSPKVKFEGQEHVNLVLETIIAVKEKFKMKHICNILLGNNTTAVKSYKHNQLEMFDKGSDQDELFWNSVIRQSIIAEFITKDIETYGVLKMSDKGYEYLKNPYSIMLTKDTDFSEASENDDDILAHQKAGTIAADEILFAMLKDLRKKIAKEKNVPPFVIFQDPSIQDMSIQYPITMDEMQQIVGVGSGKALRYGKPFVQLIEKYVKDNEIERPQDMIVKSVVNKSGMKVSIIQSIDRKVALDAIAEGKSLELKELITEIEHIVSSGTKININYYINEILDTDHQEEIFEYFMDAETDSIKDALKELGEDEYSEEEIRLMRIKFLSEMGN